MPPVLPEGPLTDEAVGRLVRPYTVSDGRTRATSHFTLVTVVRATGVQTQGTFGLEHAQVLALCESPVSVAEVAARMQVPAAVVKVLLSDLAEGGAVVAGQARPPSADHYALPDRDLLEAVRDALLKRL
ncbi:conserved hypothetical protein [Streptomyces viridochromogenes DSM 40736]|uniref:Multi-component regulatory system-3 n=1 Tax=Streptomyces viridochromogenes (strain DSM 40736 / JCM 4977 / BCRC 1201 / Tue 494) TaxID=591159 RepID=D9X5T3_STRVT|nr:MULTISPECIES: DUF742 domain-containing protein [Streptomyces]EFL36064.1 conserved hypothetical protein [Streptomyces viridochromogenes DSM 40736]MBX9365338.1 DUF742 domain-containing protein [Streptomyces sp. WAC04114]